MRKMKLVCVGSRYPDPGFPAEDPTMRAALEGVALSIRDAMTCLQQPGTPLDDMRLAGGGTTDAGWRGRA